MIVRCRDCGGKVSTDAAVCPHCGCLGPKGRAAPPARAPKHATMCPYCQFVNAAITSDDVVTCSGCGKIYPKERGAQEARDDHQKKVEQFKQANSPAARLRQIADRVKKAKAETRRGPKCPSCGSTLLTKPGPTKGEFAAAVAVSALGHEELGTANLNVANRRVRCGRCGHTWLA